MAGKCGHQACRCVITGVRSGYCSDYCAEQGHTGDERCECGHPECNG
jgi:hypothetical protein